jgi:hypothetical protein
LLIQHTPISAAAPRKDLVVGSVGTVSFEDGALVARPLMVWTAEAIGLIESEQQRELSCGYRYRADMTPGTYEGEPYAGVMRELACQHIALVSEGRVPGAMVADSIPEELKSMKHLTAITKLRPFLAANVDLLALDAALGEVASTAPKLGRDQEAELEGEDRAHDFYNNSHDEWKAMSTEDRQRARDQWRKARDSKRARDSEADHRKDFGGGNDSGATMRKQLLAAFAAREAVKPIVGTIALDAKDMDTAEAIYAFALKQAGVPIDGIHPSAYGAMVDLVKSRKSASVALDARSGGGGYIPLSEIGTVARVWPTSGHGGRGRAS